MNTVFSQQRLVWMTRVSSDRQDMARQRLACAQARERGWTVVEEVELDGVSGTSVERSPQWHSITAMLRKDSTLALGCDSINRLLRPRDFEFGVLEFLSANQVKIVLPDKVLDLSASQGDYLRAFMEAMFAGNELRELIRRTRGGRDAQFAKGEWPMGRKRLPTGVLYCRETKTWSYDPAFAESFAQTVRLVLDGRLTSYAAVGARHGGARERGRYMLRNPIYTGILEHRSHGSGPKRPSGSRACVPLEKPVVVDLVEIGKLDAPLIDRQTWGLLQTRLRERYEKDQRAYQVRGIGPNRYSGHLFCSSCQSPLYGRSATAKGKTTYYYACRRHLRDKVECSGYLRGNSLDEAVDEFFTSGPFSTTEGVTQLVRSVVDLRDEKPSDVSALRARLKEIGAEEVRLADRVAKGVVPDAVAQRLFGDYANERSGLEGAIASANLRVAQQRSAAELADVVGLFARWDTMPRDDRSILLRRFVPRIYCDKMGITAIESTVLKDGTSGGSTGRTACRPCGCPPAPG